MYEVKKTGGAKIGWAHASSPFATLTVSSNKLELNASIIGNMVFKPSDVISIVPYSKLASSGIQISHKVKNYNPVVVFLTNNPKELILNILETGFLNNNAALPNNVADEIEAAQSTGSFPIKTPAAITIVAIWNLLCLINFYSFFKSTHTTQVPSFIGAQMALGFVLLLSVSLLLFKPIRALVLKKGRNINQIKNFIYMLMAISAFMLMASTLIPGK